MEIIGLDLHQRVSQLSIQADDGSITARRIATSRERFTAVFGERLRARILLEASTESEWVARHLESLGDEEVQMLTSATSSSYGQYAPNPMSAEHWS